MSTWTKKAMFVGLPRYLEQLLGACYAKEGWELYRFRAVEGERPPQGIHTYDCEVDSAEAAQVFSVQNLDLLVYRLERDSAVAMRRLDALLRMAQESAVKQVFLLSDDEVFASGTQPTERDAVNPQNADGRLFMRLEELGMAYRAQGVPVSVIRLPELYAPGMTAEDGLIGRLFSMALTGRSLPKYAAPAETMCGLVDARDAVYAIYQATARDFHEPYLHIAPAEGTTMEDLYMICADFFPSMHTSATPHHPRGIAVLRSTIASELLGWQPRRPLAPGLRETWAAMKAAREAAQTEGMEHIRRAQRARIMRTVVPFVENVVGALLTLGVTHLQGGTPVNPIIYVDFAFIYIGCMGLLYGKQQALLATGFSLVILVRSLLGQGWDLVALLYSPPEFLHFVSYFFTAVLTGYFADREAFRQRADGRVKRRLQYRVSFLENLFKESVAIKDRLYRQIINSDDSIGRLYRITSRLDSVETENLYTQTAAVTAEILSVKDVVVYVVGEGGYYLRQKVRLGSETSRMPRSLRVEDYPYLQEMLKEKKIFVNRSLIKGLPDLAAPISYGGRVIAVLQVYHLDFEQWSLYEQNLLSITVRLVSSSLGRAHAWEQETAGRKYIEGTRILRVEEFRKVIEEFRERRRMQPDYHVTLLPVRFEGENYRELDHKIANSIRAEDFIGATADGIALLLPDVAGKTLDMVRERLLKAGIETGESLAL